MPATTPLNLYILSIFFNPSVFLAADLAAGGREGSISSTGGQSPLISFMFHFFSYLFLKSYISLNFLYQHEPKGTEFYQEKL